MRRLPVVQSKAPEDAAAEDRPAWQWILIGAGFVLTIWIPLALTTLWIGRGAQSRLLVAIAAFGPLLTYGVATIAAGALVGRFGGRAGRREATFAGLLAGSAVWGIAMVGGSLSPGSVAVGSLAVLAGLGTLLTRSVRTSGSSGGRPRENPRKSKCNGQTPAFFGFAG